MLTSLLDSEDLEMLELELKWVSEAARSGEDDVSVTLCAEFLHAVR